MAITSCSGCTLDKDAKYLASYWSQFSGYSPYEVEIDGDFKQVLLRSRSGNRTLGAAVHSGTGALLFLPPIRYDDEIFLRYDEKKDESYWTKDALQFGKRLVAALGALAASLKQSGEATPPPTWVAESQFRLPSEGNIEKEISKCNERISVLQSKKASLEDKLIVAGSPRRLLFEQGKPLEAAILDALKILGFDAQPFADGESEFDVVFVSPEGRCLGEAEGKDNKAINIDKFSQLERNLQEDFARDDVTEYAKGALFGNAFRLLPLHKRGEFFTDKCISAASRVKAALIRTPDLFPPVRYLQKNSKDIEYAKECRDAIFRAEGEIVSFPAPPTDEKNVFQEQPKPEETEPTATVDKVTGCL